MKSILGIRGTGTSNNAVIQNRSTHPCMLGLLLTCNWQKYASEPDLDSATNINKNQNAPGAIACKAALSQAWPAMQVGTRGRSEIDCSLLRCLPCLQSGFLLQDWLQRWFRFVQMSLFQGFWPKESCLIWFAIWHPLLRYRDLRWSTQPGTLRSDASPQMPT